MKNLILPTLALLASFAALSNLSAQTYNIPWHRVGPGGTHGGGAYSVSGSAGQFDAGTMSGGNMVLSGGFWVSPGAPARPAMHYTLVDLGPTEGEPRGVNSAGQIAGYSFTNGYAAATFWPSIGGSQLALRTAGGRSAAYGINDSGQSVGEAFMAGNTESHAASWLNSSANPQDLGSLGGASAAYGLNRAGQIVGYSPTPALRSPPFTTEWIPLLWPNANSAPVHLATFGNYVGGTVGGFAFSINDSGQIVGVLSPPGTNSGWSGWKAAFWANSSSAPVDLGTAGLDSSFPWAINSSGEIVGSEDSATEWLRRPLYWRNGASPPVRLPTLSPYYASAALGINAAGQIVGYSDLAPVAVQHAVLWNNGRSGVTDLNTLIPANSGWVLQQATAINDAGEIVGTGSIGGEIHAFALVPGVPALRITGLSRSGGSLQLSFTSQAGHSYTILSTSDLASGSWNPLQTGIAGNGATVQVTIPRTSGPAHQFFRIQLQ